MGRSTALNTVETGLVIVVAASALAFKILFLFGYQEVTPSVDVLTLHLKHLQECSFPGVDPMYHLPTEPFLTVVNKTLPFCITSYDGFSLTLTAVLLSLHVALFLQLRNNVVRLAFVLCSLLLWDLYTQTHLFRQTAATYLFAIWWLRGARPLSLLPIAALLLHNATTIMLLVLFFWKEILIFTWQHRLIAIVVGTGGIALLAYGFGIISELVKVRYGFFFFDRGFLVGGSFVASLYKYFILAGAVGLINFIATRSTHLLAVGCFGLVVLGGGQSLGMDAEVLFRILAPFRNVFLPLFLAIALGEIVQRLARDGRRSGLQRE